MKISKESRLPAISPFPLTLSRRESRSLTVRTSGVRSGGSARQPSSALGQLFLNALLYFHSFLAVTLAFSSRFYEKNIDETC